MDANDGRPEGRPQKVQKPKIGGLQALFKEDSWLGRNWGTILILVAIIFIALFVRSYFGYSTAVDNGFLVAGGSDSYYHQRVIGYVEDTGNHLVNDPMLNYPMGVRNMRPPLYDWSVAVTSMFMSGVTGMSITDSTGYTLLFSTAFWGALTCIPVYMLTRAAFGNRAGLLASLLFAIMPGNITRSVFADADHDAMILFFVVFGLYFLFRSLVSINGTRWVENWKNITSIRTGVKSYMETNRRSLIYAMLGGVCFAAVAMIWTGYTYMLIIVLIYFLVQVLINRFRNIDSMGEFFVIGAMLLTGFVLMAPLYWQLSYWSQWYDVPFYLFLATMFVGGLFVASRDYPWTLVIPVVIGIILLALVAVFFLAPNLFEAIVTGQGYLVKSKLYSTISEATAPTFSNLAMSFGVVTFWLAIIGLVWAAVKIPKDPSPYLVFIVVWMAVSMYMAASASRFLFNASPAFAMAAGWILALLIKRLKFEDMPRTFSGFWSNPLRTLRKNVKISHVVGVLFLAFLVILPNAWGAIDAGIPSETKRDYDKQIYYALPDILHPADYDTVNGTFWYLGAFSYSLPLPTAYYPAAWSWLKTQDSNLSEADRPAFLSWWDYGFEAIQAGGHPTVADNFQSGYEYAASFLMSENESDAVSLLTIRLLEKTGFTDSINSALSNNGVDAAALKDIMQNPSNYVQTVLDNPDVYGKFTSDISVANAKYAAARMELEKVDLEKLVDTYHDVREVSGYDIGYVAVDSRLFPFSATGSNIFYAPAKLNDRTIDSYTGSPTDYYTIKAILSDYSAVDLQNVTSRDTVLGYQIYYTDLFYQTMIYRTFMGLSPSDIGETSQGIPGYSGTLSSYDAMPAYNLTHFKQVYRTAYYLPDNSTTWEAVSYEEAKYLQSQIDAGAINGTVDKSASVLQSGVVFMQYYDGAILNGTAIASDGTPYSGVHVTVVDENGIPHQTVTTSSDGSYQVYLPFGNVSVVYSVGDLDGSTLIGSELDRVDYQVSYAQAMRLESFTANGDITLAGSRLSGYVFWDMDGNGRFSTGDEAIAGASVVLKNNKTGFTSSATSDSNGYYSLLGAESDNNVLYATYEDHTFGYESVDLASTGSLRRNIAIEPAVVSGTISFLEGGTASGVVISLTDTASGEVTNTTSGAGGAFTFNRLLPGDYTVDTADTNISAGSQTVTLSAGSTVTVNLKMYRATQITGQVTIDTVPQANVAVGFISDAGELFTTTDSSGNYVITLPQGTYTAYALTLREGVNMVAMEPLVANTNSATLDLPLSTGSVVTGVVKNGGSAVSGASVVYTSVADATFLRTSTNSTGDYRLVLPTGDYFVYAAGSGKAYWGNLAISGTSTQEIALQDSTTIGGTTWYDTNLNNEMDTSEGLGNVVLKVQSKTTSSQVVYFTSDGSGDYNITLPTGNSYVLTANLDGYTEYTNTYDPLSSAVGNNIEMVAINRTVTGTVTSGGSPVNGITVTLTANGGGAVTTTATTSGSGQFAVSAAPGTYSIIVDQNVSGDNSSMYKASKALTVEVGKDPDAVNVALDTVARVTVNVTMPSGASGSVRFIGPDESTVAASSTITEYLTPGTYTVYTELSDDDIYYTDLRSATIAAGTNIDIAPQLSYALTGQMQYDGEDLLIPANITISSGAAAVTMNANSQGSFTTYLVNGTYTVDAEYHTTGTIDEKTRYLVYTASQGVTVNGDQTVDIALARGLDNATISGTISGASSGVSWNFVALSSTAIDGSVSSGAGSYSVSLAPGTYSAYGVDGSGNVYLGVLTVNSEGTNTANVTFESGILVSGTVRYNGAGAGGAKVVFSDAAQVTANANGAGGYSAYLPRGTYNVTATWTNEEVAGVTVTYSRSFDLDVNSSVSRDIDLVRQIKGAVELVWDSGSKKTVNAGESATYDVTVYNRGNIDDTYVLGSDSSWNVTFSEDTVELPWGANSFRTVQVTIGTPDNAKVSHSAIKLNATSKNHTSASGTVNVDVNIVPAYAVSINTSTAQTIKGDTITCPFIIKNDGNIVDTYNFTVSNKAELAVKGWTATISGTSNDYKVVSVAAGSTQTVNVVLTRNQETPDVNSTVTVAVSSEQNATATGERQMQRADISLPDDGLTVSGDGISMRAPEVPGMTYVLVIALVLLLVMFVVLKVNKGVFGRRRKR